jgi:hypothetical protein
MSSGANEAGIHRTGLGKVCPSPWPMTGNPPLRGCTARSVSHWEPIFGASARALDSRKNSWLSLQGCHESRSSESKKAIVSPAFRHSS